MATRSSIKRTCILTLAIAFTAASCPAATLFVWQASPNPAAPYTNWSSAAHAIQDAVDAAAIGDTVLVTNGLYASGERVVASISLLPNRVAIGKTIELRSVNGPAVTILEGAAAAGGGNGPAAVRCALLTSNAVISGFTLRNGHTWTNGHPFYEQSGGGLFVDGSGSVGNCLVTGNSANFYGAGSMWGTFYDTSFVSNTAASGAGAIQYATAYHCMFTNNIGGEVGGAAYNCNLQNCIVSGNSASSHGGGIFGGEFRNGIITGNSASRGGGVQGGAHVYNSLLVGNHADYGGGAMEAYLYNCTVYGNSGGGFYAFTADNCIIVGNSPWNYDQVIANHCCTTPLPPGGFGNIDVNPGFVDPIHRNFHLAPGSPCIDAGTNLSFILTDDLDNIARPLDGNNDGISSFDIGAYEFVPLVVDSDGDGVSDNRDQCPDTAVGAVVDEHGCSIMQLVPCAGPRWGGEWKSHGEYLTTLLKTVRAFRQAGLINNGQARGIMNGAARSTCGNRARSHGR